jgi:RNA polymerase sigma-70 factor (ECF subfamily)
MTSRHAALSGDTMPASADQERFLVLLNQHKNILYKVAYTYCRQAEDRRDLVQDMAIQLWQSYPRFDARVSFTTWMYRIAMNVAISFYRSEKRRIRDTLPIEDFGIDMAAADEIFGEAQDNMRVLRKLVDALDEMNRALVMLFFEGFSHDEIAAVLGITPTNVATRLNRIKQKLQQGFAAT